MTKRINQLVPELLGEAMKDDEEALYRTGEATDSSKKLGAFNSCLAIWRNCACCSRALLTSLIFPLITIGMLTPVLLQQKGLRYFWNRDQEHLFNIVRHEVLTMQRTNYEGVGAILARMDAMNDRHIAVNDTNVPMVHLLGAQEVAAARARRNDWRRGMLERLDQTPAEDIPPTDRHSKTTWKRFDFLSPEYPLCPVGKLEQLGSHDDEKLVCDLDLMVQLSGSCEIISIGSNGQWSFEEAVFEKKTTCRVHTFDCTGDFPVPAKISSRVFSYKKCIGQVDGDNNYISYDEMLHLAGLRSAPTYLKIDVEGFEWNVLPQLFASQSSLPHQIQFELHSVPIAGDALGWKKGQKTAYDIAFFGELLDRAGYMVLNRRDNIEGYPGFASEYLIARVA